MRTFNGCCLVAAAAIFAAATPAAAQTFKTYHCRDGSEFVAAFYPNDKRVFVQLDGKAISLARRASLRGTRWSRRDVSLRIARNGVTTLKRSRKATQCFAE